MKKTIGFLFLVSAVAWAAQTRSKDSDGSPPSQVTDGVSLLAVTGCRPSVRVNDGGTINGGTVQTWYYDPVLGWARSNPALDCALQSNRLPDGGAPSAQVCPDLLPLARFGRIAVSTTGLVGADAGPVTAIARVECYGENLP